MAFNWVFAITFLIGVLQSPIFAQLTTSTSMAPSTTIRFDPYGTGKWGNHGARAHVCTKSLDAIHLYASDALKNALQALVVSEFSVNVGLGTLTIKPPRVTESGFARTNYSMEPPNRIRSSFYQGRLVANGVWQYKPQWGKLMGGTYKATVNGMELNATNQLGRTVDGKPMVQMVNCKANLSQYRIEIEGSSDVNTLDNCALEACSKVLKVFEDAICKMLGTFIKEIVNRELQSYPAKLAVYSDQHKVDFSLMKDEPTVHLDSCIRFGMEGKYIWRGSSSVPFYPSNMEWVNRNRMVSFQLSDFTFNTLFHQAHSQGYRFSAADILGHTTSIQELLSFNCSTGSTSITPTASRKYRGPKKTRNDVRVQRSNQCLGELFENFTSTTDNVLIIARTASGMGDIVFKTGKKPNTVLVQSDKIGIFDGSNSVLEFFGPIGQGGNRQMLASVNIRLLLGEFIPKLNKANITGTVKITDLQVDLQTPHSRLLTPEWLSEMVQFVTPILTDMFNDFLFKYAQFPVPLPPKYQCQSPESTISPRTMQVDCDTSLRYDDYGCPGLACRYRCPHCLLV